MEIDLDPQTKLVSVHSKTEMEIRILLNGKYAGCCVFKSPEEAYHEKGNSSYSVLEAWKAPASRFALLAYAKATQ